MIDELFDVGFKIARQVVVFQQDAVLERLMPAFDLALCLRMVGSAANVPHVLCIQPLSQVRRDVTGTIIAEQAWLMCPSSEILGQEAAQFKRGSGSGLMLRGLS